MKKVILFLFYALITLFFVLHHEIWRDEAQVWQICHNASFFELFSHLSNEGHPSLFYLIIMPFAKIGCSVLSMQILCWFACCIAVILLLRYSPFDLKTSIVLTISAPFLYFFPVIARNYSLIPLLVFLIAILYSKQRKYPLLYAITIFLLANSHVIMTGFAFGLIILFVDENLNLIKSKTKEYICSLMIMFFGVIAVVFQLFKTTSTNIFIALNFDDLLLKTKEVFIKFFTASFDFKYFENFGSLSLNNFQIILLMISIVIFFYLFVLIFINNKKIFLVTFFGILFQFLIYILAYGSCIASYRVYCAYVILIFAFWCILEQNFTKGNLKKQINIFLLILFLLTVFNGIKYSILDVKYPFSGSFETAKFINSNMPEDSVVFVDGINITHVISVIPYLNKNNIHILDEENPVRFIKWNQKLVESLSDGKYAQYFRDNLVKNEIFKSKKLYLITTFLFDDDFELVFATKPAIVKSERYYIYKYSN